MCGVSGIKGLWKDAFVGDVVSLRAGWSVSGVLILLISVVFALPVLAKAPRLSLPLDCIAGESCFIQNYVDVDSSRDALDYTCHKSSYDGHKGVDFRIPSIAALKKGVRVLASAPGTVKALRDGMKNRLIRQRGGIATKGRECGNGLVIDHGDGWETQYCHMFKGSLLVKKGQKVERGQELGLVGLSGETAFPHVHLTVRHNGKIVDPFTGAGPSSAKCEVNSGKKPLWDKKTQAVLPYVSGQHFISGFTDGVVSKEALMYKGGVRLPQSTKAQALVYFGMALNLQKGDRLGVQLTGPAGVIVDTLSDPMEKHKASYLFFSGKKRISYAWPRGTYHGAFSLHRNNKVIWTKKQRIELK